MKVFVAAGKPFTKTAVDGIKKETEGTEFELALLEKYTDKAQLLDAVEDTNAIIIRSDIINTGVLEAVKELKTVVRVGAEYDSTDLNAATVHDVCVMNTPGQNSNAVAELMLGLLVYAVRNFYNGTSGTELMEKKLSIHAYSNVRCNVACTVKGFGMELYAYDAFCPKDVIEKDGVKAVDPIEELYRIYNTVPLYIPVTAETKDSINHDLLKNMPKGAILVSTARKEVIDEDELIQPMEERPDFKYIADIMPTTNARFTELSVGRHLSAPEKMGAQTAKANINVGTAVAEQIVGFLKEGCGKSRVNR